jgi:hypothetical protein
MTATNMFTPGGMQLFSAYSVQGGPTSEAASSSGSISTQVAQLLQSAAGLLGQVAQLVAAQQGGYGAGGFCGPANSAANSIGMMLMKALQQPGGGMGGSQPLFGMLPPPPLPLSYGGAPAMPPRYMQPSTLPSVKPGCAAPPSPVACKPTAPVQTGEVQATGQGSASSGPMEEVDIKMALAGALKPGVKLSMQDIQKLAAGQTIEGMRGCNGQVPPELQQAAQTLAQKPKLFERFSSGKSCEADPKIDIQSLGKEAMVDIVNEKFNGKLSLAQAKKIAKGEAVKGRTPEKEITDKDGKKVPNPEFKEAQKYAQYIVDHEAQFKAACDGDTILGGREIAKSVSHRKSRPGELEAMELIKKDIGNKGGKFEFKKIASDLAAGKFDKTPELKKAYEFVLANDDVKDRLDTAKHRDVKGYKSKEVSDDKFSTADLDARIKQLKAEKQKACTDADMKPGSGEHCEPTPTGGNQSSGYLQAGQAFAANEPLLHALQQQGYNDPNRPINYADILSWDRALSDYGNVKDQALFGLPIPPELKQAIRYLKDNPDELKKFGLTSKDLGENNKIGYILSFSDINAFAKPTK